MAYNRVGEFSFFSIAPLLAAHCIRAQHRSAGHCDTGSQGFAIRLIALLKHTLTCQNQTPSGTIIDRS